MNSWKPKDFPSGWQLLGQRAKHGVFFPMVELSKGRRYEPMYEPLACTPNLLAE